MSPGEMERIEELARKHPRAEHESVLHYLERLACLAGLVKQEDTALLAISERRATPTEIPKQPEPAPAPEARLPYRENDDEWYARMREEEARREQERVAGAKEGGGGEAASDAPVITEADLTDDDIPF